MSWHTERRLNLNLRKRLLNYDYLRHEIIRGKEKEPYDPKTPKISPKSIGKIAVKIA